MLVIHGYLKENNDVIKITIDQPLCRDARSPNEDPSTVDRSICIIL